MKLAGVEQPRYADYIRLDAGEFSKTDILSLQLLAEYLAGDDTAPLYDCLVYRGKTLLGIDADVSYDDKLGGTFAFYATPAPEWLERAVLDGSGALRAVKEEIGRATEKALAGLTEENLTRLKPYAGGYGIFAGESADGGGFCRRNADGGIFSGRDYEF